MNPPPLMKPMVGWYDPRQLAKTAVEVAISTIFGRHSDHRLVEAMASGDDQQHFYDYTCHYTDDGKENCEPDPSRPRKSIWIDYVGDVGDGWNSTYTIAYHMAQPTLWPTVPNRNGTGPKSKVETNRGDLLIFGGDEVYPTASRQEYNDRLVGPYETALRNTYGEHPHVFAVPGNHDWYDSLVAFTRLFTARPWFAGWRTRQTRSYFALKLPHNWWLLGTDVQLGSDIDGPQMDYFKRLATAMDQQAAESGEPARIILCHAEPHWIRAAQYQGLDPVYTESNVKLLEKRLAKNVAVFIAGDLHHYRRHQSLDKSTQKITAGGGGAFLHPTHYGRLGINLDTIVEKGLKEGEERTFKLESSFPPMKDSQKLTWRNLLFPFFVFQGNKSWSLGIVTAALYLLLTLVVVLDRDRLAPYSLLEDLSNVTYALVQAVTGRPLAGLLILATIVGFMFFTDTHSNRYRILMGGLHAIAHIVAAFIIALLAVSLVNSFAADWLLKIPWFGGLHFEFDLRLVFTPLLILIGGFIVGPLILGIYLIWSLNFWGRHGNEAFSSLAVEDWKSFLRLNIDENGDLTIYPIGIRRVPKNWEPRRESTGPELIPKDAKASDPELIEEPIMMKRAKTKTGVESSSPELRLQDPTKAEVPPTVES